MPSLFANFLSFRKDFFLIYLCEISLVHGAQMKDPYSEHFFFNFFNSWCHFSGKSRKVVVFALCIVYIIKLLYASIQMYCIFLNILIRLFFLVLGSNFLIYSFLMSKRHMLHMSDYVNKGIKFKDLLVFLCKFELNSLLLGRYL